MSIYDRRGIAQKQRQQKIQAALKNNQHTLVQMNPNEFMDFMFNIQRLKGKSQTQTVEWIDQILENKQIASNDD